MRVAKPTCCLLLFLAASVCAAPGCVDSAGAVATRNEVKSGSIRHGYPFDWFTASDDVPEIPGDTTGEPAAEVGTDLALTDGYLDDLPRLDVEPGDKPDWEVAPDLVDLAADACVPQCEGKECGWDMCTGTCGICSEGKVCNLGKCKKCAPDCLMKECGSNGCGGTCGECPSMFNCYLGACMAPACEGHETIFEENFDSCTQGSFEITDFQPDDNVTWWSLPLKHTSPPCALYLGDPDLLTYFTGSPVHLQLLSPYVTIPESGQWRLTFSLFIETEPVPAPQYPYDFDVLYLRFIDAFTDKATSLWSSKEILNSSGAEMSTLALDISSLQGAVGRFLFEFDTVDSTANDYPGIFLDDFVVDSICPYCMDAGECDDQDPCTIDDCVLFGNFDDIGTCTHAPEEACCIGEPAAFCDDFAPCTIDHCDDLTGQCENTPDPDCEPDEEQNE